MDLSVEAAENRTTEETIENDALKAKTHFSGKVLKVAAGGALVDIGQDKPGFLHISQVAASEEGVKRVEDVLQVGAVIDVWVRRVKEGRVELTMVQPLVYDWKDLKPGMTVTGRVVKLETYGAFVDIGAERPGLIHISEMAHGYVRTPADVVKEGDEVEAQILDVIRRKKQIKLSMKALQPEPVKEEPEMMVEDDSAPRQRGGQRGGDRDRRRRSNRGDSSSAAEMAEVMAEVNQDQAEAVPTAMEMAYREAMAKAREHRSDKGSRRNRSVSQEQEEIISRTLQNKVRM